MVSRLSIYSALFFACTVLHANEHVQHEQVVVIGSRSSANDIDVDVIPSHVTVVQTKDLSSSYSSVADVLKAQAGVQIRQQGGMGSYSSLSIRGSTGAQVNVYLDGVLLNSAQGGAVDLSELLLDSVERIEIYRGYVPLQLGSAGIGGAVNVVTKQSKQTGGHISLTYGSFNSSKFAASSSIVAEDMRLRGSVERVSSDNDFDLVNDNQTPSNPLDDRDETRQNAQYDQLSAALSGDYAIRPDMTLSGLAQYYDRAKGIPGVVNDPTNKAQFDTEFFMFSTGLDHQLTKAWDLSYQLALSQRDTLYDDTQNKVGLNANLEAATTQSIDAKVHARQRLKQSILHYEVAANQETYDNHDKLREIRFEAQRQQYSLGLQGEWFSRDDAFSVMGQTRFRAVSDETDLLTQDDRSEQSFDAQLGLNYQLNRSLKLRTSLSRDIRLPSLYELYGDDGSAIGNADLEDEVALNAEAGFQFSSTASLASLTAFYRDLTDAIVTIYDARGIGRAENISSALLYGLEFDGEVSLYDAWKLGAKGAWVNSEDRSQVVGFRGNPLPGQYEYTSGLVNQFLWHSYLAEIEFVYRNEGFYDRSATTELPESKQVHAALKYSFSDHQVELVGRNLTDERIEDFNRYPAPGRHFYLSYKYVF
ncbi:hypothetical protein A3742_00655 [Oleiphilus sp. HI0071]|uniref:TonB-dependent receptor n=4 Tax=unclassified Oleiphilus TaxID=2631174 RepID=UPI0007C2379D|nr:TonB-dependent receptor [Oleiphilus sp. HI0079]KZY71037.1 hypothetical protein A3737_11820 [Oleiphilus sp. HI0065]KZY82971.1 hypothetical protein A3742_00655 [Oleiphilus sp. HI0071]KZZ03716.1 hypothetical protein A3744_10365 [Oleiphilus sp. HI0073]KZZ51807.1 hypothetical protein A3760_11775 [Oleiphilus sp. HI0122]KZZ66855.1 hypothetical protein A3765_04940 [Oleiphilus sp. HI0130]KZZ82289.1 hypothetical protein A3767_04535 [Oleiphilus sp. HI0133]